MLNFKIFVFTFITYLYSTNYSYAQKLVPSDLTFRLIGKEELLKKDSIQITTCKFYISNLTYYYQNSIIYKNTTLFKLIDLSEDSIANFTYQIPSNLLYDKLTFDIGIDSTISKLGVQEGELDPTKGMYWAWQSGYINFKLEGTSPKCNTRKNRFQFHIGGFLPNQYAIQTININNPIRPNTKIDVNLINFINQINLKEEPSVMIPGKRAIEISNLFQDSFKQSK